MVEHIALVGGGCKEGGVKSLIIMSFAY